MSAPVLDAGLMSAQVAGGPTSLGLELERQRLASRARRLAAARAALHERASSHEARGKLDAQAGRRARRFERGADSSAG